MKTLLLASALTSIIGSNLVGVRPTDAATEAVSVRFTVKANSYGPALETPKITLKTGTRSITISTQLSAPNPCQQLRGTAERKGKDVTVRVTISSKPGFVCIATIGNFFYEANLDNLTPGKYRVRVIHDYPNTGWRSGTVLQRQVNVRS